jgi:hypothetical protein
MRYTKPLNAQDPGAGYWDATPGRDGAYVPFQAVENPQREIVKVIEEAGLDPTNMDLTQLCQAIGILIARAIPVFDKYDIAQYYPFQDDMPRPGMFPLIGTVVENFSSYPDAVEYFTGPYGQARLVSRDEYDARHVAIWATLADGSTVGWNGEGGVNVFVWDQSADTLLVPDLSGMSWEQISASLGVGQVDGDRMRELIGSIYRASNTHIGATSPTGIFEGDDAHSWTSYSYSSSNPTASDYDKIVIRASRGAPTGAAFAPRRFGSLACVYLGLPAS